MQNPNEMENLSQNQPPTPHKLEPESARSGKSSGKSESPGKSESSGKSHNEKNVHTVSHFKCTSTNSHFLTQYPGSKIVRPYLREEDVKWSAKAPEYAPIEYTSPGVLKQPVWADDKDPKHMIKKLNTNDGKIDRRSEKTVKIVDGRPMNIVGRTGITGRGQLGKWGPNHAADPVVTRWKRHGKTICKDKTSGKPILEFVAIKRKDNDENEKTMSGVKRKDNEWAIPGGMVDSGEKVSLTLSREFAEEALNALELDKPTRAKTEAHLKEFFKHGKQMYKGYVDDPRNTDNAWMETTVFNFHDGDDKVFTNFPLAAGDDAGAVKWMTIDHNLDLYATHKHFIKLVVKEHDANW